MTRILFITGNLIGDAVLSTGALVHLMRTHPDARFTIVCGAGPSQLFSAFPALERVIVLRKAKGDGHWRALLRELWASGRFDLAVDLRGSLVTWFIKARSRLIKRTVKAAHAADDLAAVVGLAQSPHPQVWPDSEARAFAALHVPDSTPVVALCPGASWSGKKWPADRFATLARRLVSASGPLPGARLLLIGGPGDEAEMAALEQQTEGLEPVSLGVGTRLLQAAAVFERAALFVGNDSGLMHVAAAAGCPTLGLFGPTDPARYAPRGRQTAFVRTQRVFDPKAPDAPTSKTAPQATGLMDSLTVDAVDAAARRLLSQGT